MNKKVVKWIALVFVALTVVGSFAGCGASKSAVYYDTAQTEEKGYYETDMGYGPANDASAASAEADESTVLPEGVDIADSRKLIKDGSFSVQTSEFDTFLVNLKAQITSLGGYVASSNVCGNSYGYEDYRSADITARIPAEQFDAFTESVSSIGTVINRNESVRDVTSSYIDTESHITALQAEQEALLEILRKAATVSEIIELQTRLTEVRAELESYQSQLKTYDDLIAFSTITVNVTEVERVTAAEKEGFFAEIGSKLGDNLYSLGRGFRSFAVWFISSLPYFLLLAAVALTVILPVRHKMKKKKSVKRNQMNSRVKKQGNEEAPMQEQKQQEDGNK